MLAFNLIVYIGNCKMEKYNKVIKLNNFEPKENALSEKELRIQLAAAKPGKRMKEFFLRNKNLLF